MKRRQQNKPNFTRSQRKGMLALALLVLFIQLGYFIYLKYKAPANIELSTSDIEWLNQQIKLDSLQKADSSATKQIYPFNPNFISDFKGYQLGMSVDEIDRLHQFRAQNKYVNSAQEFQTVTQISDSLLQAIQPFFKFPEWTQKQTTSHAKPKNIEVKITTQKVEQKNIVLKDLNVATAQDLQIVYGIGEVLSNRIIAQRNKYKAFVAWDQLDLVYGLSPDVIQNLQKYFEINDISNIVKLNINDASIPDIAKIPYINNTLAKQIVIYRSKFGDFNSISDLKNVANFPSDKSEIIRQYLEFN